MLARCFESFSLIKPLSSEPHSSERFLILTNYNKQSYNLIPVLQELQSSPEACQQLNLFFDINVMRKERDFIKFV